MNLLALPIVRQLRSSTAIMSSSDTIYSPSGIRTCTPLIRMILEKWSLAVNVSGHVTCFIFTALISQLTGKEAMVQDDLAFILFNPLRVEERMGDLEQLTALKYGIHIRHLHCMRPPEFKATLNEQGLKEDCLIFFSSFYVHPNVRVEGWEVFCDALRQCGFVSSTSAAEPILPKFWTQSITGTQSGYWPPNLFQPWVKKAKQGQTMKFEPTPRNAVSPPSVIISGPGTSTRKGSPLRHVSPAVPGIAGPSGTVHTTSTESSEHPITTDAISTPTQQRSDSPAASDPPPSPSPSAPSSPPTRPPTPSAPAEQHVPSTSLTHPPTPPTSSTIQTVTIQMKREMMEVDFSENAGSLQDALAGAMPDPQMDVDGYEFNPVSHSSRSPSLDPAADLDGPSQRLVSPPASEGAINEQDQMDLN
jgi:hypothetical protein